eukprot:SAG31_NODE_258_length_18937_cov_61.688555_2_plen_115_part_00
MQQPAAGAPRPAAATHVTLSAYLHAGSNLNLDLLVPAGSSGDMLDPRATRAAEDLDIRILISSSATVTVHAGTDGSLILNFILNLVSCIILNTKFVGSQDFAVPRNNKFKFSTY